MLSVSALRGFSLTEAVLAVLLLAAVAAVAAVPTAGLVARIGDQRAADQLERLASSVHADAFAQGGLSSGDEAIVGGQAADFPAVPDTVVFDGAADGQRLSAAIPQDGVLQLAYAHRVGDDGQPQRCVWLTSAQGVALSAGGPVADAAGSACAAADAAALIDGVASGTVDGLVGSARHATGVPSELVAP